LQANGRRGLQGHSSAPAANLESKMLNIVTNWKTTAVGLAAIFAALSGILHDIGSGVTFAQELSSPNIGALLAGFVGIFAKDSDVTGVVKK
jgi:hypothetical protein